MKKRPKPKYEWKVRYCPGVHYSLTMTNPPINDGSFVIYGPDCKHHFDSWQQALKGIYGAWKRVK